LADEIIIAQSMKTDKLFYKIFLSQPDLISELLPGVPPNCEFEYSAPVVKEAEVRLDGLFIPSSLSGKPKIALIGCVRDSVTHPITPNGVLVSA
jgi:Protein of unknown function (DUF2887)